MTETLATPETETHYLMGWGTFADLGESLLARIFGHMVILATPVVKEYHSDLFHDATWLREYLTGPTSFDFLVRTSGTNIGHTAFYSLSSPGAVMYKMTLTCDNRHNNPDEPSGAWSLIVSKVAVSD